MQTTKPAVPHVIIVERDDAVGVMVWSEPGALLATLSPHFSLGRTKSIASIYAIAIAARIRAALRFASGELWGQVEFDDVVDELESFDPQTGAQIARGDLQLTQRVHVRHVGAGIVQAFAPAGRIVVALDEPRGALQVVHAPRSLLKPVLRPVGPS